MAQNIISHHSTRQKTITILNAHVSQKREVSMRIYISGAISSDSNYKEKFKAMAAKLERAGYTAISPTDLPGGLTEGEYMQLDHLLIGFADAVFMLSDWSQSKGAMIEYELAVHMGKLQ